MARRTAAIGAVLVVAAVAVVILRAGSDDHVLRAVFQSAVQVVKGQEVRLAGVKVGEVGSVREDDGQAVVELKVQDSRVWPLHRGTIARLRFGTTVSYGARYVELFPGPDSAPTLPPGGVLSTSDTITPVEFDQIFNIFDPRTRRDLQGLVGNGADALDRRAGDLSGALRRTPGALDELASVMQELGADRSALGVLARQGAQTSAALARVDGPLRRLVDHAAATFDELAAHAGAQRAALERMPGTLHTTSGTLGRLDRSLATVRALVADLRPGARGLRQLAGATRRAVTELNAVAPLATRTLRTGRRAAPNIRTLLREGVEFMPQLRVVMERFAPALACIRPYGPEIAGALGTWAGFGKNYDGLDHYARTLVPIEPYPGGTNLSAQQVTKLTAGGTQYAFPRPPGLNAGQPWLLAQCGAGAEALDAARDPETPGRARR